MSKHVYVISEWQAKTDHEAELRKRFQELMVLTLKNESGCISARVTHQIQHPGSPTTSKYTIVLQQEYIDVAAFDIHCNAEYVKNAFKTLVEDKTTAIVEDWRCRLFTEDD